MKKLALAALLSVAIAPAAFAQSTTTAPSTTQAAPGGAMGTDTGAMGTTGTNAMGASGATMNDIDTSTTAAAGTAQAPFVTVAQTGVQRLSDIQGEQVYGSEGESIGEVNDVLIGQDGRVAAVIVGVGGFLGLGEKDVAVSMDALTLPTATDTATTAATTTTPATGTGATTSGNTTGMANDESDRIMLDVTKAQLEQAPAYQGRD